MAGPSEKKTFTRGGQDLAKSLQDLSRTSPSFLAAKNALKGGDNYLRQTERIEVKAFDDSFIVEMEKGFEAIGKIVANPRTFIKEQPELVEAGLARKISALSVSHLASHAQFVRNVDEQNNVHPDKILTIFSETDSQIYENRFIMTLIRRCLTFLQERYNFIIEHGETFDSDLLLLHSSMEVDGLTYSVDTRVQVRQPSNDAGESKRNQELLARMALLRQKAAYFLRSPFMEEMKGAREVSSPIHMTNMIVKHPDYHRAYLLWAFLDEYESLGISFDVTETNQRFDDAYYDALYNLMTASVLTLSSNRVKDRVIPEEADTATTHVQPRVILTLEDETYDNSRFLYNHFPEQKGKREDPLALTPEEAAAETAVILEAIERQKKEKPLIEADILADKDALVLALSKARKQAAEALEKAAKAEREKQRKAEEEAAKAAAKAKASAKGSEEEDSSLEPTREEVRKKGTADRGNDRK